MFPIPPNFLCPNMSVSSLWKIMLPPEKVAPSDTRTTEYLLGFVKRSSQSSSVRRSMLNSYSGITQRLAAPAKVGSIAVNPA